MAGLVKKLNEQCVESTESKGVHGGKAGREATGVHVYESRGLLEAMSAF